MVKNVLEVNRPKRSIPAEEIDSLAQIIGLIPETGMTRTQLSVETGLTRSVVSQRVSDLMDRGLVRELGAASTGGRPPRSCELVAEAGYVLVAELGATHVTVAVADLSGRISAPRSGDLDIAQGPETTMDNVDRLFAGVLDEARPTGELWAVGMIVPAPVQFATGTLVLPPLMQAWEGWSLRDWLVDRYHVPVWLDDAVNAMALAEWRTGAARGHSDVIFVKVGTGIGAGIIAGGRIYRGAKGLAGDIGHVQVRGDRQVMCRCGLPNCVEALAGGAAIADQGTELARSGQSRVLAAVLDERGSLTAADVGAAAAMGDPVAADLIARSGQLVGEVISGLVNFFNPSMIVVGGGVSRAGSQFLAAIRGTVYGRSLALATHDLEIRLSALGTAAGVTGASAMVLDEIFSPKHLAAWINDGNPVKAQLALSI